ncbi:hypothetical protein G210_2116 [Candida maltosa Xu316]|uniref:Uncharacterized protein n=1 Tax=Candida maltosa (strain Xu316) TaxID=1245528 RepID=M3IMB8_CANMX|nr:hypothetical protein G210_2116 [Candida maltosa Xu316]
MEQNYKLALKQFVNKNFPSSFKLIHELFRGCFNEYSKKTISLNLLIKIINLYLMEIGVCLKDNHLNQVQYNIAINSITSNEISNQIHTVFGSDIPCEILYNFHLMFISNPKLLITDKYTYLNQLRKDYVGVDDHDKYKKKFMELVIFEILPTFDEYEEAERLIKDPSDLPKLRQVEKLRQEAKDQQRVKALEQEKLAKELKENEIAMAKEKARQSTLKYKSIKEIQKNYGQETPPATGVENKDQLKNRLFYLYGIVRQYLKDNYLVILVAILLALGSSKYLKKVNIKEKIVETVKMAFKFSYV